MQYVCIRHECIQYFHIYYNRAKMCQVKSLYFNGILLFHLFLTFDTLERNIKKGSRYILTKNFEFFTVNIFRRWKKYNCKWVKCLSTTIVKRYIIFLCLVFFDVAVSLSQGNWIFVALRHTHTQKQIVALIWQIGTSTFSVYIKRNKELDCSPRILLQIKYTNYEGWT